MNFQHAPKRFGNGKRKKVDSRTRAFSTAQDYTLEPRHMLTASFVGDLPQLADSVQPLVSVCSPAPMVADVASRNALQPLSLVSAGFEYKSNPIGATITKYTGTGTDVVVPQFLDGLRVTEIGDGAFQNRGDITRVVLPVGVTRVGRNAFYGDSKLKSISLPEGLTEIADASFCFCSNLSSITLPTTLTTIRDWGFYGCTSLKSIELPNGFRNLLWGAFRDCTGLATVTLSPSMTYLTAQAFQGCNSLTGVVIPRGIVEVGADAFTDCSNLKSVVFLGDAPSKTGDHPFQNDANSTAYYLQGTKGWTSTFAGIPTAPFAGQNADYIYTVLPAGISISKYIGKAIDVTVPQKIDGLPVVELGIGAFQGRGDVSRVVLPIGITKIGNNAFDGCGSLTSVNIPDGVRSIGDTAFIWCGSLRTLTIPSSVTSIGIFWSFWGCGRLTAINVDAANTKYASQDGILYSKDFTWLYWCPGGKSGEVTLASATKTIGYHSFQDCYGITRLTIPASVTLIEDGVFNHCTNLRSFFFRGNAPTVRSAFDPDVKSTVYYVRGTSGWGKTLGGVPTATTALAPTGVGAVPGNGAVTLSWTAPSDDGGTPITGYSIRRSIDGGKTWSAAINTGSTATSFTVAGLANGTSYLFRVAAVNAAGVGDYSTTLNSCRPTDSPDYIYTVLPGGISISKYIGKGTDVTVPRKIDGLPVVELGVGAFQGRGDITRVVLPTGITKIGNNAFDGCGSLTSVNIPEGVTEIGDNAFIWCGRLLKLEIPSSVTRIGYFWAFWGCGSLTAINVSPQNATFASWDGILYSKDMTWLMWCPGGKQGEVSLAPPTKTIGYFSFEGCTGVTKVTVPASLTTIEGSAFHGCSNLRAFYFQGNAPSVSFDAIPATVYYVRSTSGWGNTLGGLPTATTALAPTGVAGVAGNRSVALQWTAPSDTGRAAVTSYSIQTSTDGGKTWSAAINTGSAATSYTMTGLTNGTSCMFRIAAVTAAGTGDYGAATASIPVTVPSAPTGLKAARGNGKITVTWLAPVANGGSPVTDYIVFYSANGGATWKLFADGVSTATSATVTGLSNTKGYVFRIAARNAAGQGPWSSALAVK
jgi:hypothetical protein